LIFVAVTTPQQLAILQQLFLPLWVLFSYIYFFRYRLAVTFKLVFGTWRHFSLVLFLLSFLICSSLAFLITRLISGQVLPLGP